MNNHNAKIRVSIQQQTFDLGDESRRVAATDSGANGAIASFVGMVRATEPAIHTEDDALLALEIEHYPAMTQRAIEAICDDANRRWPFNYCRVIHRVGHLAVGEPIVLVLVASSHRKEAFAACEFIMDYLKTSAPFWKKAIFARHEQWVDAKTSDTDALHKWRD